MLPAALLWARLPAVSALRAPTCPESSGAMPVAAVCMTTIRQTVARPFASGPQFATQPSRARMQQSIRTPANMLSNITQMFVKAAPGRPPQPEQWGVFQDNAPSWADLAADLEARQLGMEKHDPATGPPSAKALVRTFGSSEAPRVKLYRDSAAWCPYCQKVWLQLEEKRIPYTIEKINMRCYGDKPASFLAKVPAGLLPVLEVDGTIITESATIAAVLEQISPDTPLTPPLGTPDRARAERLMKLERTLFSAWMSWLTSGFRHDQNKQQFQQVMETVDEQLAATPGPYFLGTDLSLVDLVYTPFLERIAASLAYYKGYFIRGQGTYPHVEAWFDAMETRETYLATRADYYSSCHDLPPQLGGCAMHADGEAVAAAIDGRDGSWTLPLPPLTSTSLEAYSPGDTPAHDTLAAAAQLIGNHSAIVGFATRATGPGSRRPVSAELSDPHAVRDETAAHAVDAALRHVAHALLVGPDAKHVSEHALKVEAQADGEPAAVTGPCLAYMRDRVGVPRDMSYPAARQLRAHLNWFISSTQV